MSINEIIESYLRSRKEYGENVYLETVTRAYLIEKTNDEIMSDYIRVWDMEDVIDNIIKYLNLKKVYKTEFTRKSIVSRIGAIKELYILEALK